MENKTVNTLLVCKGGSYKIKSKNLKNVCPACGVDKIIIIRI